jgi:hypothetical protein
MASITMSASSSELDVVGPGAGGWVGSALAVPIANAESPITAPTNADNSLRIATPIAFSLLHSLIPREASTGPRLPHAQHD